MRFLIVVACLLNVAWAEDRIDEDGRKLKQNRVELPDWAKPGYEEEQQRKQRIESDRTQEQTYQFQMLDQMERLNKNLEERNRR